MKKSQTNIISTILLIMITFTLSVLILNFYEIYLKANSKNFMTNELVNSKYDAKILGFEKLIPKVKSNNDAEGEYDSELYSGPNPKIDSETIVLYIQRLDNEGPVTGIRFKFTTGSESIVKEVYKDPPNNVGGVSSYYFSTKDLSLSDLSKIENVEISLLLENGYTKIIDTYEI